MQHDRKLSAQGARKVLSDREQGRHQAAHEARLRLILGVLDQATSDDDVKALHGLRAHRLSGKEKDFISVWVNGNWRVTFRFVGADIELVDYRDYH